MRSPGGYIRGPWWKYKSDDEERVRRCFVIAWGYIVKDPDERYSEKRNSSLIRFVLKTGRGANRNEKHLVCVSWGEKEAAIIMRSMEKGDLVLCAGTWVERAKKGTNLKTAPPIYEMHTNYIVPLGLISFILDLYVVSQRMKGIDLPKFLYGLYMDEHMNATAMRNARIDEDADVWESDDYDYDDF